MAFGLSEGFAFASVLPHEGLEPSKCLKGKAGGKCSASSVFVTLCLSNCQKLPISLSQCSGLLLWPGLSSWQLAGVSSFKCSMGKK